MVPTFFLPPPSNGRDLGGGLRAGRPGRTYRRVNWWGSDKGRAYYTRLIYAFVLCSFFLCGDYGWYYRLKLRKHCVNIAIRPVLANSSFIGTVYTPVKASSLLCFMLFSYSNNITLIRLLYMMLRPLISLIIIKRIFAQRFTKARKRAG
jgi:hypothetical protein